MNQQRGHAFLSRLSRTRHNLPFSPKLLQRLFDQTSHTSRSSMSDVARTVSQDQGLTARVLTLANSAYYGLQAEVNSIERAIVVLGVKEVRTIVLALGVQALSRAHPLPEAFDLRAYWLHQLHVAAACRTIAATIEGGDVDQIFTSALLHDLGKLITAMHAPEDWLAIEALRAERNISYSDAEEEHWGLDHGVLGSLVLQSWNLPAALFEPVNWHHNPDVAPIGQSDARLIGMVDEMARDSEAAEDESAPWREQALILGLKPDETQEVVAGILDGHTSASFADLLAS